MKLSTLLPALLAAATLAQNSTRLIDPSKAQCTDPYLTDANSAAIDRWNAAGASAALNAVTWLWDLNQTDAEHPTRLKFTEFVSNYFHGGDLMICGNMGDGPCQHTFQCDELSEPAGYVL